MPARVVVHTNSDFLDPAVAAFKAVALDAVAFDDSMRALDALDEPKRIEVLVTCVDFGAEKPNGVTLARMARSKRPWIKVVFIGASEAGPFAAGLGQLLPPNTEARVLADTVRKLLPVL